jgi:hypothetical protein
MWDLGVDVENVIIQPNGHVEKAQPRLHLYIHIYVYINTYTYVCNTYIHTYVYTQTDRHTHTHTHLYIICKCMCTCICIYMCIYMYVYVYVYIPTCCVLTKPPIPSSRSNHFIKLRPNIYILHISLMSLSRLHGDFLKKNARRLHRKK